jgi:hypothetical protein
MLRRRLRLRRSGRGAQLIAEAHVDRVAVAGIALQAGSPGGLADRIAELGVVDLVALAVAARTPVIGPVVEGS